MEKQNSQSECANDQRPAGGGRRLSLLLALCCICVMATIALRARAVPGDGGQGAAVAFALSLAPQNYGNFSHSSPGAHANFSSPSSCANCHPRNGSSPTPTFPGHKACINCHLAQFTTANTAMCNICHTGDLSGSNPPLKAFPKLNSFRVLFDHQQHVQVGAACLRCHDPARRGVGFAVPDGLNGHKQCYECHSPGLSAANLSACGTCHSVGGYTISTPGARAYSAGFSHATHGPRQRLACTDCHIVQRYGLPPAKQVASPSTFQHFPQSRAQSCATCHNDKRAFGEADFGNCKRCHKGSTFNM